METHGIHLLPAAFADLRTLAYALVAVAVAWLLTQLAR